MNTFASARARVRVPALAALFLSAAVLAATAATYHVSTSGSDQSDGSAGAPFATIGRAAQLAVAGDTVLIRGGTYRETVTPAASGTAGQRIVFEAYQGETVIVSGLDPITTSWSVHSGSIYKTTKSLSLGGENQLFYQSTAVSSWLDKSGQGHHAVQTVAGRQPHLGSSGLVWDGVDDFLSTSVGSLANGGFLLVGKFNVQGPGNSSTALSWSTSGSQPGTAYVFENYANSTILSLFYNSNGGTFANYTNGTLNAKPTAGTFNLIGGTVAANGSDAQPTLRLGGNHNSTNHPSMELNELFVWNSTLSTEDREKLEGYAAHKWGLASQLPAAHPYKEAPPASWAPTLLPALCAWYDARDDSTLGLARQMMIEARWPNSTDLFAPTLAVAGAGTTNTWLSGAGLPAFNWTGATMWLRDDPGWSGYQKAVTGFDSNGLTLASNAPWPNHELSPGSEYFIFGTLDALDAEGEWFYHAASTTVYAKIPGGEIPTGRLFSKTRRNGFVLNGRSYVSLKNIDLRGCTIQMDAASSHLEFDGLNLQYPYYSNAVGGSGAQSTTGLVLKGAHHAFRNSELGWASGSGLVLQGDYLDIVNNHIHDCDFVGTYAAPISMIAGYKAPVISHNTIARSGRSSINYASMPGALIQYNDIHDAGLLTNDLGMIYGYRTSGENAEIRYNWVHDNKAGKLGVGIYFDHGSHDLIIHHNVVWNVEIGMILNQYGLGLLAYNNTLSATDYMYRSIWGLEWGDDMYGCVFANNVGDAPISSDGIDIDIGDNLESYSGLVDHRYLPAGSPGLDSARPVAGITDGIGSPDKGAYEGPSGNVANNWVAGHNFLVPPTVDRTLGQVVTSNRVQNGAFEFIDAASGQAESWTTTGASVQPYAESLGQNYPFTAKKTLGGFYSMELGAGTNSVSQLVTGLLPNSRYEFRGRLRVPTGEAARLLVAGTIASATVSGNAPAWSDTRLIFDTGPTETSVSIAVEKTSQGPGLVYVDDLSLFRRGNAESWQLFSRDWTRDDVGWDSASLAKTMLAPRVVCGALTANGADPSTLRLRNAGVAGFEYQLDAWDYLNPRTHAADETFGVLVVDAGVTSLDGLPVEALAVSGVTNAWTTVTFSGGRFSGIPVVFAQTVTTNETSAVTVRIQNVTTNGCQIRLQEQESGANADGDASGSISHLGETVHLVAIAQGVSSSGAIAVGRSGAAVTDAWTPVAFGRTMSSPRLIAQLQTYNGGDPAGLRYRNLTATGFEARSEEEGSADTETAHGAEAVGWLVWK